MPACVGDHGTNTGPAFATEFGQLDFKLPFFVSLVPAAHASDSMPTNTHSIIGAYDVHRTLRNIASRYVKNDYKYVVASARQRKVLKAISSFDFLSQTIPANRKCIDAGISHGIVHV